MNETRPTDELNGAGADAGVDRRRRRLLLWLSGAVYAAIAATFAAEAFRFLRPPGDASAGAADEGWTPLAPVAELSGAEPLARRASVERLDGWSRSRVEQPVYVLPAEGRRVLSAVCPHEGCEVEWEAGARQFLCPCHDSRFDAHGRRLSGPAEHDLAELPARVSGDVLEVQYRPAALEVEQGPAAVRG